MATTKKTAAPRARKTTSRSKSTTSSTRTAPTTRGRKMQAMPASTSIDHVRVAAYYVAESDGFVRPPEDYWYTAESTLVG